MRRLLFFCLLWFPVLASAQNSKEIEAFFEKYAAAEQITCVQLEPRMMQLMAQQAEERGDRPLAKLLKRIRYIRIVAFKGEDHTAFVDDVSAALERDKRFPLVTASTEEGQTTNFYLREARMTDNSELVMVSYGPKETVVVNIYGGFDLKQVVRLSAIRPR